MSDKIGFPGDVIDRPMREILGAALVKQGAIRPEMVILSADAMGSTQALGFARKYPERSFNFGIAEQEMVSAAAGLALCGKTPVVTAYGFLLSLRSCEQVRTDVCYANLNVKLVATHTGISMGAGGATHHSIEDLAIMRSFPNMSVMAPADGYELTQAVEAMLNHNGPVYLRAGLGPAPAVYGPDIEFKLGLASILRNGKDLSLIAHGAMVQEALLAADILQKEGIEARVINMSTIKPMDQNAVIQAAGETGAIVTVEEHTVMGGLGDAVAHITALHTPAPMKMIGIQDIFCGIGPVEALREKYGLDAMHIAQAAREVLELKR